MSCTLGYTQKHLIPPISFGERVRGRSSGRPLLFVVPFLRWKGRVSFATKFGVENDRQRLNERNGAEASCVVSLSYVFEEFQ